MISNRFIIKNLVILNVEQLKDIYFIKKKIKGAIPVVAFDKEEHPSRQWSEGNGICLLFQKLV